MFKGNIIMKLIVILFMFLYLYSLSFGIFLTETIRVPAPMLFAFPLIFLFREKVSRFLYHKELWVLVIALFCYYVIGLSEFRSFAAYTIAVVVCILYFNYFIGGNRKRFHYSVLIFYLLLAFSSVIMVLNHFYPAVDGLRGILMDEQVLQSPSGIAVYQFNFGYQLAALVSFALLYAVLFNKYLVIKGAVFFACLVFIYLGMQRSVFVTFLFSVSLFLIIYYRLKAVFIICFAVVAGLVFYEQVLKENIQSRSNILTKNMNNDPAHNRTLLTMENLNIYADYPMGLVFYGKNWGDAIYRNQVFSSGLTSHNAYLMFFTYLGPFLGLGLLVMIYGSIVRIGFNALKEIRRKENALLICLGFSFLAVSLNAFSHNASLISADGPTLFLYFSILHLHKIIQDERSQEESA